MAFIDHRHPKGILVTPPNAWTGLDLQIIHTAHVQGTIKWWRLRETDSREIPLSTKIQDVVQYFVSTRCLKIVPFTHEDYLKFY
jgi:hypothetical protein